MEYMFSECTECNIIIKRSKELFDDEGIINQECENCNGDSANIIHYVGTEYAG